MLRRLLSTYPKYTIHSPQYKAWSSLEKDTQYRVWGHRNIENKWGELSKKDTELDTIEYGFKREIVPSDFEYEKPKDKPKDKIWEGWIP